MAVQGINNRRVQAQVLQTGRRRADAGGQTENHRGPPPMVPEGVQNLKKEDGQQHER